MNSSDGKILLGISSCLLGTEVRFDGSHRQNDYILGTLGRFFEFLPVCPEMAIGLGVPRQPIHLVRDGGGRLRAVGVHNAACDVTGRLEIFARESIGRFSGICGYIFKSKSPSCGVARVNVYDNSGVLHQKGRGVYAGALMDAMPQLPVVEDGFLADPVMRESFIERVFVYHRWHDLVVMGLTTAELVDFHRRHKLVVMAHSQVAYRRLGNRIAQAGNMPLDLLAKIYLADLMKSLQIKVTPQSHVNVLQHLMGYLKKVIDAGEKVELLECLEAFRLGQVPLIAPITLLKHHFRRHPHSYVASQYYLELYAGELMRGNA